MSKLTDKQEMFCQEYIKDLNATQAAIRAGYSKKTAEVIGSENLIKPKVKERIQELKDKRVQRTKIDADYMTKTLQSWLEVDVTQLLSLTVEQIKSLPLEVRKMVQAAKPTSIKTEDGQVLYDIKFVSKEKAAEMLSKHIGYFEKDNEQKITLENNALTNISEAKQLEILTLIQDAKAKAN
jgi:phage terminase small subunit